MIGGHIYLLDKGNLDLKALYEYLDKVGMNCGFLVSCERSTSHVLSTCPSNDSPFPDPSRRCLVWNIFVGPLNKWHFPCGPWWLLPASWLRWDRSNLVPRVIRMRVCAPLLFLRP
jgi:hypothetical protein